MRWPTRPRHAASACASWTFSTPGTRNAHPSWSRSGVSTGAPIWPQNKSKQQGDAVSELAVEVNGLKRSFGDVHALNGLHLEIKPGIVFGLLGPNGAGKTTLVRVLSTLLQPSAGSARVLGHDVVADQLAVRRRIGLAGQFAAVDNELTGRENLIMVARLSRLSAKEAARRATESLERYSLADVADRRASTYSGGMRRRLDLAAGLIASPPLVLLDEPTTGLDPRSRQELWDAIAALQREGTTVLLTTQYLEEVDRLAERIAVIDQGRIVAQGTPSELKDAVGQSTVSVQLTNAADQDAALAALSQHGIAVGAVDIQRPSLDDVFLELTGHKAEEPVLEQA
ncbi:MAG: ATP-binding cassette domain-containing protein [Solirubrobacterales bacterium]|nr:ATP-binding cassette domain-containing protein [Solirubrobacterales bacterium]